MSLVAWRQAGARRELAAVTPSALLRRTRLGPRLCIGSISARTGFRRPTGIVVASGPNCPLCMQPAGHFEGLSPHRISRLPFPSSTCVRQPIRPRRQRDARVEAWRRSGHPPYRFDLQIPHVARSCYLCGSIALVLPQDQSITKTPLGVRLWRVASTRYASIA